MAKDTTTKETGGTATVEQEQPAPAPQTPEQIEATEKAIGLSPKPPAAGQTLPARVQVRMGVAPANIEEGWRLAQYIAQSELVPKGYRGRPADVLVAIQYGMEVGLPPMAALHSIFVTNGRPSLWGDGFLAVIMASSAYKDHDEYYLVGGARKEFLVAVDLTKDDTAAICTFWRSDNPRPRTSSFSVAQAKKAGLWTKAGPWQDYPDRMLKFRARGFAGHDTFPEVLRGIRSAEEAMDTPEQDYVVEVPKEVRRISETTPGPVERAINEGSIGTGPDRNVNEVVIGPIGVKSVEQFLGGFTVFLADGQKVDMTEAADAMDLDKFAGSKNLVRLVCTKVGNEPLLLKSFSIAD